ncbi:EamA family transporter [Streptomyces sp. TP-A0874]|uniref:EamA family transporter n=1 Tax=Streptomyces sp. TP-A0874 TaxID=549819 RepID=UPI000853C9BB|nr:EamA family transporter [Streptomyces sp. TP-A0874]
MTADVSASPKTTPSSSPAAGATVRGIGGLAPASLLMLLGMLTTQIGTAFAKHLFGVAGPAALTVLRLGFAAAVLLLWWRPSLRLDRRTAATVAALGVAIAGMNVTFYLAIVRMPVGVALTVAMAGPLMVAALSCRRVRDRLWTVLAGAGIGLLGWQGGAGGAAGLLIAIVCAVFWGAYVPLSTRVGVLCPGGGGLALAMGFGTLCTLPIGLADGGTTLLRPSVLAFGFAVAMLSSLVPHTCEMEALRRVSALVFGVLLSLEPAIGALAALFVLDEKLTVVQLLGLLAVFLASVGVLRSTRRSADDPSPPSGAEPVTARPPAARTARNTGTRLIRGPVAGHVWGTGTRCSRGAVLTDSAVISFSACSRIEESTATARARGGRNVPPPTAVVDG